MNHEEAFYRVLGEGYKKFFATGFNFTGYEMVEQDVQGNTVTMYQGIWKGKDQMDGCVRKICVKKETIDKIIAEAKK